MKAYACNYNPLATVQDSCFYNGDAGCPAPDLIIDEVKLRNTIHIGTLENTDGCFISEGCMTGYGTREVVRFTTHIRNIGEKDYYVGNPTANPDQFTFDNCHNHNHYDGYAEYILFDEVGTEIPIGKKTGFCVIDLECSGGGIGKYTCNNMGITAGCGDVYDAQIDCQWIDITDTPNGIYTLVTRVNWDNAPDALGNYEKDFSNNWSQACIRLYTDGNTRRVERLQDCEAYVDCAGVVNGSTQPDCEGVCGGPAYMGDVNQDGLQEMTDAQGYVTKILNNSITPNSCNDLNDDDAITVYDAALLSSCLIFGAEHEHPETGFHDHCRFPQGIMNPNQTVELSIDDINSTEKYLDIYMTNIQNSVNAYQFDMSGINITSVENLVDPAVYPMTPEAAVGGQTVIGIAYTESYIAKSPVAQPLCRIYYSEITDDQICIASITEIINQDYEQTLAAVTGDCIQITGIDNPLTVIEAYISPNPAKDEATLYFPNPSNELFTLKITDVTGRVIRTYKELRDSEFTIQRDNIESGVYLFHLESDRKMASGKLVLH